MIHLPSSIIASYSPATAHEVHSWSFGCVKSPRRPGALTWQEKHGTLDDQGIFGPIRDFECACAKYKGKVHQGMICDRCGVKVTTRDARWSRFGHIELGSPVLHPLVQTELIAVPVLPAAFLQSNAGEQLACLYERMIEARSGDEHSRLANCLHELFGLIAPLVIMAHEWNLQEKAILARGLALECLEQRSSDFICECGCPLAGLASDTCPGCGKQI